MDKHKETGSDDDIPDDVIESDFGEDTKLLLVGKTENPDKEKYPKAVFFIIGNEFCERFSYYGMKTILTLFLVNIIRYDDDTATTIFHTFSMGCYFTPIFGAMLADSYLGKYKTIFYISIIYAIGNIVLSSAAIPNGIPMIPFTMIGLTLIAIGTGGIKPCVAAFGGDQFSPNQEKELQKFFSFFYLSINCGSMISTILTPYLREDVKCFGDNSCFALAFGVPAILMIVSLIVFVLGRPLYKIIAPTGNIVVQVVSAICYALGRKIKSKAVRKEDHWLNYAEDKYDKSFLSDIKDVLHVLFLYLPLPVFWALFDQQGSRWTLQANAMDGHITGKFRIKPDQMQMINPFLILFFIPLFEYCIYPLLEKCHLLVRPLQRITTGGILASAAFIVAAFVQIALEKSLPVLPSKGLSQVSVINTLPCNISLSSSLSNLSFVEMIDLKDIKTNQSHEMEFFATNCSYLKTNSLSYNLFTSDAEPVRAMMITDINNHLSVYEVPDKFEKPDKGESKIRILFASSLIPPINSTITFYLSLNEKTTELKSNFSINERNGIFGFTDYVQVDPGIYKLAINNYNNTIPLDNVELNTGGSYIVTVVSDSSNKYFVKNNVIVQPNSISMLYQIPQYVIITAGEIMFSITGLEFSYSQAPTSMKSVLQAAWLLTVAFGNIIVVIVSVARFFSKQSYEFFMFAGLMMVDMMLFSLIAYFYKYVEAKEDQLTKHNANENNHSKGIQNAAFLEDSTSL